MTPLGPTPAQRRYLDAIARLSARNVAPSLAEIADEMRVTIPAVCRMINQLERRGLLSRRRGQTRSLSLYQPPPTTTRADVPVLRIIGKLPGTVGGPA